MAYKTVHMASSALPRMKQRVISKAEAKRLTVTAVAAISSMSWY